MAPLRRLRPKKTALSGSFPVTVTKEPDGFFVAECPLFDGCYSQGSSEAEALENVREAILLCIQERMEEAGGAPEYRMVKI